MSTQDYKEAAVKLRAFTAWAKAERIQRPGRAKEEAVRQFLKLHNTMAKVEAYLN